MILEAFIELMQEKQVEKITVTDIVKRADLNRGTFYAHYQNPLAVLAQIENDIVRKMLEFLQEVHCQNFFQDPLPLLKKVENYIEENLEYFRKLISSNGSDRFIIKLQNIFVEYIEDNAEIPESIRSTGDFLIRAHFFAGGIANTYQSWLCGALDKSLHEISIIIGDIIISTFEELPGS